MALVTIIIHDGNETGDRADVDLTVHAEPPIPSAEGRRPRTPAQEVALDMLAAAKGES